MKRFLKDEQSNCKKKKNIEKISELCPQNLLGPRQSITFLCTQKKKQSFSLDTAITVYSPLSNFDSFKKAIFRILIKLDLYILFSLRS